MAYFKVEWGWEEPQAVGDTMCFTVFCFQRNGQPYPICDTDELVVNISHGTRKVGFGVMKLLENSAYKKKTYSSPRTWVYNIYKNVHLIDTKYMSDN